MEIGPRLKWARKLRAMSQDELAKTIGVSRGVITNIEYNRIDEPQAVIVDAISRSLKISKEWLLTGKGEIDDNSAVHKAKTLSELYDVASTLTEAEQLYLLDIIKAMKERFPNT